MKKTLKDNNSDIQKGINVVLESLLAPLHQIAENAGFDADEIVSKQKVSRTHMGFDAKNGTWVNMFDAGIVDPTKVTRSAILNASSISALFITTEAAVADIKEDKPAMPNGADMYD